jgi:hypothetical protein
MARLRGTDDADIIGRRQDGVDGPPEDQTVIDEEDSKLAHD